MFLTFCYHALYYWKGCRGWCSANLWLRHSERRWRKRRMWLYLDYRNYAMRSRTWFVFHTLQPGSH